MTLHREGNTIMISTFVGLLVFNLAIKPFLANYGMIQLCFGIASLVLLGLVIQFFRVPEREVIGKPNEVLCPADGKVVVIEEVEETEYFKDKRIQISVFMSPLNVHAQWSPIAGIAKFVKYHAGKYLVAWHPKSSTENERTTIVFANDNHEVLIRQIAGAVARRIVYYPQEGQSVKQGDEVGFIKFGSRVDIFLPLGTKINVALDQKVTGRKTVLAKLV